MPAETPVETRREKPEPRPRSEPRHRTASAAGDTRSSFKAYSNVLLRYIQVGGFAGCLLGALLGGFWRPEGYFVGGILGGLLAAANEWLGDKKTTDR